jgi:ATP-dependent Lon protease
MKNELFIMQDNEEEMEFMPILPLNEEAPENLKEEDIPDLIPILPLRNTVLYPGVILPITVGRDKSIKAVQDANDAGKMIGVVAQKDSSIENPKSSDLADTGTAARIIKLIRMPDGGTTIISQ